MDQYTKDNLGTTWQMEKEELFITMAISMRENGLMIKHKVMGYILIIMERFIKEIGFKICKMDLVKNLFRMVQSILVSIKMEEDMEMGNFLGQMTVHMRDKFSKIYYKVKVNSYGEQVKSMKVSGKQT
jgi:hypothetical protein